MGFQLLKTVTQLRFSFPFSFKYSVVLGLVLVKPSYTQIFKNHFASMLIVFIVYIYVCPTLLQKITEVNFVQLEIFSWWSLAGGHGNYQQLIKINKFAFSKHCIRTKNTY